MQLMAETGATQMYYTATCGYDFAQSTDSNGNITTSFSKIGNSCPENHYCRLTWMKQKWASGETAPIGIAKASAAHPFSSCGRDLSTGARNVSIIAAVAVLLTNIEKIAVTSIKPKSTV